ncbi:MAG: CapA family protein, partial [Chloroflexota bacterium]
MRADKVSLYAVGDVIPGRPQPEYLFELAMPTLKQADILFGQLETPLSEKGDLQVALGMGTRVPADRVSALTAAGFNVMSFASNHTMNWGEQALFETMDVLARNKIAVIGVGRNIEEARKPLILERKGTKIGFLAYCSVLPKGYDARHDKSGAAPLRASTFYEQIDWQTGTPPRIITLADKNDLSAMLDDIKKVRPLVDVLVLSMHWGVHFVPGVIAMYQKEVGYAAIDAGVDLIVGHHAHILKGIEVYKGKVIFYSLCNFVM